jgi:hypothetical protein
MIKKRRAGIVGVIAFAAALSVTAASAHAASGLGSRSAAALPGKPVKLNPPDPGRQGVTVLTKKSAAAPSWSQTNCWGGVNNGAILPWYGAPVSASQAVTVSASEGTFGAEFIGDAPIYPLNVQVVNSAVLVRINTGWGSPLNVCLHYLG